MHAQSISLHPVRTMTATFMLMIGLFLASNAHATSLAANQARFDALYEKLLKDPSNVDLTLEYADLAVELSDYEAAIPPLERILLSNPGSNKIKLELGMMYYLLGSRDVARTYFTEINQDPKATPEFKQQAQSYLKKL